MTLRETAGATPAPPAVAAEEPRRGLDRLLRERLDRRSEAVDQRVRFSPAPLAAAQERLWFLERLAPGGALYNVTRGFRLRGRLDRGALGRALAALLARHEALRTGIAEEEGAPVQVIRPAVPFSLAGVDLGALPPARREREVARTSTAQARTPFDLSRPPLLRARLLRLAAGDELLVVSLHHIVFDGWSLDVLIRDLTALYRAFALGGEPELPALPIQFADYAVWERKALGGDALRADLDHWRRHLGGDLPPLDLPADRPRSAATTLAGGVVPVRLADGTAEGLRTLARRERATLFTVLLAGWAALLGRYSAQTEVVVGTPVANRGVPETEGLIGCFVNTLVFKIDLAGDLDGRRLVAGCREVVLEGLGHARLPFARLVEALAPARRLHQMPLFEAEFAFHGTAAGTLRLPGLQPATMEVIDKGIAEIDLALEIRVDADGLAGDLTYRADRFERSTAARIAGHLESLYAGLAADPDRPVVTLPLWTAAERAQLLAAWADGPAAVAPADLVHRRIEARAAQRPDALAVVGAGGHLSYGELDRRAERLARRLRAGGAGPDRVAAVLLESSPELVVAVLAGLKAGATLLPLDPEHPPERLALMLADGGARTVVTCERFADRLPAAVERIVLDAPDPGAASRPGGADPPPPTPALTAALAYVVYTSGSTGLPKGVGVPHGALAAHCAAAAAHFRLTAADRVLLFAAPVFDVAFEQMLPALTVGATLLVRGERIWTSGELGEVLAVQALTVVDLPAAYWGQVVAERAAAETAPGWAALRLLIVGGDVFPPRSLAPWGRAGSPAVRVLNAYGPTETTITATTYELPWPPPDDGRRLPIGGPLPGRKVCVLDRRGGPLPVGVPGELCLGGAGVARGYRGRPRTTAERFVPDPFSRVPGARLYRSGDLGRLRADGGVEFLGRLDRQVKMRGFRIELGEIEAALGDHPRVRAAAVAVFDEGPPADAADATGGPVADDRRLVAYVVTAEGEGGDGTAADLDAEAVRRHLAVRLPRYMVPTDVVVLPALPLTPSGKVDRRRLPPPERRRVPPAAGAVAPRTAVEEVLAAIWSELLGVGRVGTGDNFFDLGGHSLHATRHMYRLHELLGVDLHVADLFAAQTVGELAELVEDELAASVSALDEAEAARLAASTGGVSAVTDGAWEAGGVAHSERFAARLADLSPARRKLVDLRLGRARDRTSYREAIPRRTGGGPAPLSWSQEILWFVENQETVPPSIYRFSPVLALAGPLGLRALQLAFDALADRHDVLRTRFGAGADGASFQQVDPAARLRVELVDLTGLARGRREAEARHRIAAEARVPFDLGRAPLFRPFLFRLAAERHWLLLSTHHIIFDDWAFGVFYRDLGALYGALRDGRPVDRPAPSIRYADYAVWERERLSGDYFERLRRYWHGRFADGLPQIHLRTDRPRPPLPSYRGAFAASRLSAAATEALRRRSRAEEVSLFMVLLAAFKVLVLRRSGQTDVMVACANANRPRAETEDLVGSFFNLMLLRTDLGDDPTLRQLLVRVRETSLAAFAHQDFPFILVAPGYRPPDLPAGKPPIQVLFTFQNTPPVAVELSGLTVEVAQLVDYAAMDLDLLLSVRADGDGLAVVLVYDSDLFTPATAAGMQEELRALLTAFVEEPERRLSELAPAADAGSGAEP